MTQIINLKWLSVGCVNRYQYDEMAKHNESPKIGNEMKFDLSFETKETQKCEAFKWDRTLESHLFIYRFFIIIGYALLNIEHR